jgi:hypothetical protein
MVWMGLAHSATPGAAISKEETVKQTDIYHSRGAMRPEGYVIDRSLLSYSITLPKEFIGTLLNLRPTDRWLDIGAGEGRAILDYVTGKYDALNVEGASTNGAKANAVAISIEDRRTIHWHQTAESLKGSQISYVFGRRLREYSLEELGKFQVISDVLGGFSYTETLTGFMEKTLALLDLNGNFYTVLQDVRAEYGNNRPHYPDAAFLTEIIDANGAEVRVCSWLKQIGCAQVTCEFREGYTPPIEVYRIRKICNEVSVPALVPVHFQAGTPPERRFRLSGPTSGQPVNK